MVDLFGRLVELDIFVDIEHYKAKQQQKIWTLHLKRHKCLNPLQVMYERRRLFWILLNVRCAYNEFVWREFLFDFFFLSFMGWSREFNLIPCKIQQTDCESYQRIHCVCVWERACFFHLLSVFYHIAKKNICKAFGVCGWACVWMCIQNNVSTSNGGRKCDLIAVA